MKYAVFQTLNNDTLLYRRFSNVLELVKGKCSRAKAVFFKQCVLFFILMGVESKQVIL